MSLEKLVTRNRTIVVSFEFFPPKTDEMEKQLWTSVKRLEPIQPDFVSVTYGAGGSTRERTHATVKRLVDETTMKPAAHLTCVAASKAEIEQVARAYWDAGVRHIVALRGDMPDFTPYRPHPDGYASTAELVAGLKVIAPFEVSVSCYPERHPESPSIAHDIELLKRKVDAGASRAIAQFCFDADAIARLRDAAAAAGIFVPILPALMPTSNFKGLVRMSEKCGTTIPGWMHQVYRGLDEDAESRRIIAATVMADQVQLLSTRGFNHFHFYTLNQADLTYAVCRLLGL